MLAKFKGVMREFGVAAGLLYLLDRVLRAVSPRLGLYVYEMMVQPIADKPLLPPNLARRLRFETIGPGHPDLAKMPPPPAVIASRFAQGAVCVGTYRGDAMLGYLWLCSGTYHEDETRCDYELVDAARSVFDFDLYVFPEHRMALGFMGVWHGAIEHLRHRGVRYSFSRLTRFNTASRRAHARLGWRRVGRVLIFVAWGVELLVADMAPCVKLSWSPRQRACLRLRPDVLLLDAAPSAPAPTAAKEPAA